MIMNRCFSFCFKVIFCFSLFRFFSFNEVVSSGGGYARWKLEKANKEMLTGNKCCHYIGFKDYFKL